MKFEIQVSKLSPLLLDSPDYLSVWRLSERVFINQLCIKSSTEWLFFDGEKYRDDY